MRWGALFADLEAQLAAADEQGRVQEVAELTRAERAAVTLSDRLRASVGASLRVTVADGEVVTGVVTDAGPTWLLLAGVQEHLVPVSAVAAVAGLSPRAAPTPDLVLRRLGLGHVLRAIARDRSVVRLRCGGPVVGRLEGVGADHVAVAVVTEDSRPSGEELVIAVSALTLVTRL